MALFADDDARAFREAQQQAVDRARELPADAARAELTRLTTVEAGWLATRRTRLNPTRKDPR